MTKHILITTDGSTTTAEYGDKSYEVQNSKYKSFENAACAAFMRVTGINKVVEKKQEPEKQPEPHLYKAGDKVRITANTNCHCFSIGEIVTLYGQRDEFAAWRCTSEKNPQECGNWVRESDMEPYTEPAPTSAPMKLYCVKDYKGISFCLKRGTIYEWNKGMQYENRDLRGLYSGSYKEWSEGNSEPFSAVFPLVQRPAKVGEWIYINNAHATGGCYKNGDILHVTSRTGFKDDVHCTSINGKSNVSNKDLYIDADEYLVLDGYDGRYESIEDDLSNYEWIEGVKGFGENLRCMNGFQYEVGGTYDLGEKEVNGNYSATGKGFHFCKTKEDVIKRTNYSLPTSRYCKVRGLVKKGSTGPIYCARKIEILEEIAEPKYYSGRVVCTEISDEPVAKSALVIGAVYKVEDGCFVYANGQKSAPSYFDVPGKKEPFMGGCKFIEYKGEA